MIFNTVIQGGGTLIATGTVTANFVSSSNSSVTVTGLNFKPSHVVLIVSERTNAVTANVTATYDENIYETDNSTPRILAPTFLDNGFSYASTSSDVVFRTTFSWIAWAE